MPKVIKGAFIFIVPDADSNKHRAKVATPSLELSVVGVRDLDDAVDVAKGLVADGTQLIELCAGFGPEGTAKIIEAVGGKIPIGSVSYGVESSGKFLALIGAM
jgi:hypothetical protein